MWTDPTFIDALTIAQSAQSIFRLPEDETKKFDPVTNPLVNKIRSDSLLSGLASLVIFRDAAARLNAYSQFDVAGRRHIGGQNFLDVLLANSAFDLDGNLQRAAAGQLGPTFGGVDVLPNTAVAPDGWSANWLFVGAPRIPYITDFGVQLPRDAHQPTGVYSSATATSCGQMLSSARVARAAQNDAFDSGLAATIASNWTAARAAMLSLAQAVYPERGYT